MNTKDYFKPISVTTLFAVTLFLGACGSSDKDNTSPKSSSSSTVPTTAQAFFKDAQAGTWLVEGNDNLNIDFVNNDQQVIKVSTLVNFRLPVILTLPTPDTLSMMFCGDSNDTETQKLSEIDMGDGDYTCDGSYTENYSRIDNSTMIFESRCDGEIQQQSTIRRISDETSFNAGTLQFNSDAYPDLVAMNSVCGSVATSQWEAIGTEEPDIELSHRTIIMVGADYNGKKVIFEIQLFGEILNTGSYSVVDEFSALNEEFTASVEIFFPESDTPNAETKDLLGTSGTVTLSTLQNDSASGSFDITTTTGETFTGSFEFNTKFN